MRLKLGSQLKGLFGREEQEVGIERVKRVIYMRNVTIMCVPVH